MKRYSILVLIAVVCRIELVCSFLRFEELVFGDEDLGHSFRAKKIPKRLLLCLRALIGVSTGKLFERAGVALID